MRKNFGYLLLRLCGAAVYASHILLTGCLIRKEDGLLRTADYCLNISGSIKFSRSSMESCGSSSHFASVPIMPEM